MKRLILVLFTINLLLTACGANSPVQENSSVQESNSVSSSRPPQPSSIEPVADKPEATYLKFANTDWGMTVEEVATAMGWSDSDWVKLENPDDPEETTTIYQKDAMNMEQFGATADVLFFFEETGLSSVRLYCKEEETVDTIMSGFDAEYLVFGKNTNDKGCPSYRCGSMLSEHPKWEQMRAQLIKQWNKVVSDPLMNMEASLRVDGEQPLVYADYFWSDNKKDETASEHVGVIELHGSAVAWANSLE